MDSLPKPIFDNKNKRKPKENQYIHRKTNENLRKTNVFIEKPKKT